MKQDKIIQIAALLGGLGVGIGAFGAHGLEELLESYGRTDTFKTAVTYHFWHVLALLGVAALMPYLKKRQARFAVLMFLAGIVLFSGSLYILSLSNVTFWGAVTPFGGLAFIAGWAFLLAAAGKNK